MNIKSQKCLQYGEGYENIQQKRLGALGIRTALKGDNFVYSKIGNIHKCNLHFYVQRCQCQGQA